MNLGLCDVLRAQYVGRWGMVNTSRDQSVAEHSYNVAMIVRDFCVAVDCRSDRLIVAALEHDAHEVVTGDVPTPTKRRLRGAGIDVDSVFETPNSVKNLTPEEKHLLKLADITEAYWFLDENGVGRHAKAVKLGIEKQIHEMMKGYCTGHRAALSEVILQAIRGEMQV